MYPPPEELVTLESEAPPSIMGRIGQQTANLPSNILNDIMGLAYNVGIRTGDQPEPGKVPLPYDIPEAQTMGEMGVDIGSELVKTLPLFLSGEGAGVGVAKLAKAAPMVTRMLRLGGAFGTAELADSPERAAAGTTLGAGMGAVEAMLPKPAKFAAAAGLGLATAGLAKHEGATNTSATIQGTVNALLPLLFGPKAAKTTAKSSITDIHVEPSPPGFRENIGLRERYDLTLQGERPHIEPPLGSLIREPIYSEGEAMKIAKAREIPPSPILRLSNEEELPFRTSNGAVEIIAPPQNTRRLPFDGPPSRIPPEGSLIREATFTEGEALRYAETQQQKVATLQQTNTTTPTQINGKNRLLLSTVLTPENPAMAETAAKKLGLQFDSVYGSDTTTPLLQFTPIGGGSTITIPIGATFKDLKNAKAAMEKRMSAPRMTPAEAKAKLAELRAPSQGEKAGITSTKTKVATLQNPPPSPLETVLPHDLKVGNKAVAMIEGEKIVGTLQETVESGTVRFVEKDGTPHDLSPTQISPVGKKTPPSVSNVESVGGPIELESAIELSKREGGALSLGEGGKMRLSNFGEQGVIPTEVLGTITRYVAAPTVGAAIGYAVPQKKDQRLGSAITGAAIAGLLAVGGSKVLRRLAAAHPDVRTAGSFSEKISKIGTAAKEDSVSVVKAITGNEQMAARAASRWGLSSDYDKLARGIEKIAGVNPAATRFLGKARGLVNDYANIMHTAINGLSHMDDIDRFYPQLTKFFEGRILGRELAKNLPEEAVALAETAMQARTALQNVVIAGLGEGKLSTAIEQSIGKYLTTAYKIFHDPKYRPTEKQIEEAAESLGSEWGTLATRIDDINNYLHELKTGQALWGRGGRSVGSLLSRTKELTPEFKSMLGEYETPLERMSFTAVKLINAGRSAEYFNEVARGIKSNGLKFAYSRNEREVKIATLQSEARLAHSPVERDAAAAKLADIQGYVRNTDGASTGRLSNMYLDRRMRDQLANYTFDVNSHLGPMARGLLETTNAIKYGQIILSPLQLVRQVYQMPILGMMAKTNPLDWAKAGKTIFDKSPEGAAELRRLKRLGVFEGTSQTAELREDIKSMMDGTLDRKINERLSQGLHKWEEMWRTPDLIIRVAAFQRMEAKLLEKYGSDQAARATNEAIDHMNRYTMNYSAVPPVVKVGRQLPFVNQYLSFAYEAMRITKNLGEDALKGDPHAIGVLATVATAPFLIQQMSESQLSPEDNKEWQKVKALGRDYERHNFRFVQGRNSNGDFRYISFSPLVLHDPWLQSIRAVMAGDTSALAAANPIVGWENTPLLNVATTLVSGRNRFTGQKLHGVGDYVQEVRRGVAPLLLGTDLDRIQRALTPNEDGTSGVIDTRTGKVSSISDVIQTYATSMRPYTVRPAYLLKQAQAEVTDRIRSQQLTYRSVLATNASQEVKAQAKANFEKAMNHILLSFKEKFGVELPEQQ